MLPHREPAPRDVGLQNERTGLAWQRTMLSGLTCGLLVARLLADASLTLAILTGVLSLGTAAAFGLVALRRFRLNALALEQRHPVGDGRSPALASVLLGLTAVGAIGFVLLA